MSYKSSIYEVFQNLRWLKFLIWVKIFSNFILFHFPKEVPTSTESARNLFFSQFPLPSCLSITDCQTNQKLEIPILSETFFKKLWWHLVHLQFVIFPKWTVSFLGFWFQTKTCNARANEFSVLVHSSYLKSISITKRLWELARVMAEENQNWDNQAWWMYSWRVLHGQFPHCLPVCLPTISGTGSYISSNILLHDILSPSGFALPITKKTTMWVLNQSLWRTKGCGVSAKILRLLYLQQSFCTNIAHKVIFRKKKVSCESLIYSFAGEYVHGYMTLSPFYFLVKL